MGEATADTFSDTWDKFYRKYTDILNTTNKTEIYPKKTNGELIETMLEVKDGYIHSQKTKLRMKTMC